MKTAARLHMCSVILVLAALARPVEARDPHITNADPAELGEGMLVTITGSDFGSSGGGRPLMLMRAGVPGCPIPTVDWQPSRILALVTGCPPGSCQLGIREYPDIAFVERPESNTVPVTVRPVPPARRAGREEEKGPGNRDPAKLGRPYLSVVHPELSSPGEELNLYGVFPFPDRTNYKAVLKPSGPLAMSEVRPQMLPQPLEVTRSHARVRLPAQGLLPGEYFLSFEMAAVQPSNEMRIIIRSTQAEKWEYISHLDGSGTVPFVVHAAVWKIRLGDQYYMDILGRGFGPNEGERYVQLNDATQIENRKYILRHAGDSDGPLYAHPASLGGPGTFWSDTRIRVNLYWPEGHEPEGPHFVYVGYPGKNERCSNAVRVVDPYPR